MTQPAPDLEHVELTQVDPDTPVDHPDDLTDAEAAAGHGVYLAVDDLDDDSTGAAYLEGEGPA